MPARTYSPDMLLPNVSKIFDQAQSTSANHQKNLIALFKLQSEAAAHSEVVQNGMSTRLTGERIFEDAFISMISRVLSVKKGASVADRIMKFVGAYIKFMMEKDVEARQSQAYTGDDDEDTTASRFIARVLRFLLKGCVAKNKWIRYRVIQCIAEMIAHLGQIDEDMFQVLRTSLLERLRDKESIVRAQAALALSEIYAADDPGESPTILEVLLDNLNYDVSPDVRRSILVNLRPGSLTLPGILARTRDVDTVVRRSVYSIVLNPDAQGKEDLKSESDLGLTHPRALSISQRELIVRNGLGDRDETVKAATVKLLTTWMDVVSEHGDKPEEDEERSNVLAFLKLFDLFQSSVSEDALLSVFSARPDILDSLEFPPTFWGCLTSERAFLVRVFTDHCVSAKNEARLEAALPVTLVVLASKIQNLYNEMIAALQAAADEALLRDNMQDTDLEEQRVQWEDEQFDRECIIGELLKLALHLADGDEIGRRAMFQLVREMITRNTLPEGLVPRCLDVLRKLSASERDLIRLVVEVVHELRDVADGRDAEDEGPSFEETPGTVKTIRVLPKPASEISPQEKAQTDEVDLRCLSLCIAMLERVNGRFEDNSTLEGILGELIVPAVRRKELALREKGLVALGLCCLIARRMALNSFQLFLSQVQTAPEVLKLRVLQIVFDILMINEGDFLGPGSTNGERIIEFLLHILESEESDKVQALLCVGISKLMLSGMMADDRILCSLVLAYLSPETADNQELRQCLTYFFPVYCFSSPLHQRRMQRIFVEVYTQLCQVHRDWNDDQEIITLLQAGLMFVDWTDPSKASVLVKQIPGQEVDTGIHIDLASDITKSLFSDDLTKAEKKALCQLLGKLYIPDAVDDDKLHTLKLLMYNLRTRRPLRDATSKNAFDRFDATLTAKFEKQLEAFDEGEYRQLERLKELFEFLDDIIPFSDDDEAEPSKKRGARKRRSESVTTDATSTTFSGDEGSSTGSRRRKTSKAKRRRLSQSDDESDAEDDRTERGNSPSIAAPPTRFMPRRSAAESAKRAVIESMRPPDSSSDDDSLDEDNTPSPSRRASGYYNNKRKTRLSDSSANDRRTIDEDEDESLTNQSHDSIMDSSDDDEDAEEVNDIL